MLLHTVGGSKNLTEMVKARNIVTSGVILPYNVQTGFPAMLDMISSLYLQTYTQQTLKFCVTIQFL